MAMIRGKKLIMPWEIKRSEQGTVTGFTGSVGDLDSVLWNLQRLSYPFREYNKKDGLPEKEMAAVMKVFELFDSCYVDGRTKKLPWVLVASESKTILQALAKVVPMAWALSTRIACFNATTEYMADLYGVKRPSDDFEPDPAGDMMWELRRSGLLVWDEILAIPDAIWRHKGRIAGMLSHKYEKKSAMLVLAFTPDGFKPKEFEDEIKKRYGPQILGMLDYAMKQYFKSKRDQTPWAHVNL